MKNTILNISFFILISIQNCFGLTNYYKLGHGKNCSTNGNLFSYLKNSKAIIDTVPLEIKQRKKMESLNQIENNYNYFQKGLDSTLKIVIRPLIIKPSDIILIQFGSTSLNLDQVSPLKFSGSGLNDPGFLVDEFGMIKIPVIGTIKAAGKTRTFLADTLEQILREKELVKEPIVQVRFAAIKISIMGDVVSPGTKSFVTDRVTLIDAILASGGVNETSVKNDVKIIREVDGVIKVIHVNLIDASFLGSPSYQLEQNDIVYVDANNIKLKQLRRDKKTFIKDFSTGITLLSGVLLIFTFIKIFK